MSPTDVQILVSQRPNAGVETPSHDISAKEGRNLLLSEMGEAAADEIRNASRQITLPPRTSLSSVFERENVVVFPETGLIALQTLSPDGALTEVGAVGAEGALGLLDAFGEASGLEYFTLTTAVARVTSAEVVRRVFEADPQAAATIWRSLGRTQRALRTDIACASRHKGLARLADRLLAYARGAGERLWVTQDDLAQALGLTRTSVTALMTSLSNAGLTKTGRGWIEIRAPERLQRIACGCRQASRSLQAPSEF